MRQSTSVTGEVTTYIILRVCLLVMFRWHQ